MELLTINLLTSVYANGMSKLNLNLIWITKYSFNWKFLMKYSLIDIYLQSWFYLLHVFQLGKIIIVYLLTYYCTIENTE
jgi:hypothetical protein